MPLSMCHLYSYINSRDIDTSWALVVPLIRNCYMNTLIVKLVFSRIQNMNFLLNKQT